MKTLAPALLICLLSGTFAYAQSPNSVAPELAEASRKDEMARLAQTKSNERFDAADADKDGMLSRAEVTNRFPYFDQNFERYDKNKDGALSWEEFVGHDKWPRPAKAK